MKGKAEEVKSVNKSLVTVLTDAKADREDAASQWASPGRSGRHRVVLVMQNPTLLTSRLTYPSRQCPFSFMGNSATSMLSVALTMSSNRNSLDFLPTEQPDSIEKYPAYIGGLPVYVYHRSSEDSVNGVQLLRYVNVPPSQGNSVECLNRLKSEGADGVDFLRYDSQDLGRDCYSDSEVSLTSTYSPIVVVAIDFGTTYSGYAYSFLQDPDEIHMMRKWEGGDPGIPNAKTPTVLLLNPSHQFHSFGYSARDFYHDLPAREARQWFYFDKFKMTLHHQKLLNGNTIITAANGESLSAIAIFAHSLRFFKEHALRELSDQTATLIRCEDVRWVITVPAIWRSAAKQLMREAAYAAGMASPTLPQQLLISLEPEAASLFCRQLKRHQLKSERPAELHLIPQNPTKPPTLKPWNKKNRDSISSDPIMNSSSGQRYMVVDCGGGTVDITVHQVIDQQGHHLKELHRATGGPFGSIGVDIAFDQLLDGIFGADFMNHFKGRLPASYVDLMVAFEARKRHASPYRCNPLNIALPFSFIDCYRKYRGKEIDAAIRKYGNVHVRWSSQGMLRLDQEAMRALFHSTLNAILEHIEDVLCHEDFRNSVNYLFLVGGFAESPLLQQAVRDRFDRHITVVIPQDVSLAILKGAVLYGINPKAIMIRRSRLTYGVAVLNRFIQGRHPEEKRVVKDGVHYCKDILDKFVLADQSVSFGERVVRSYSPARRAQPRIVLNIFCSEVDDVQFVTDSGVCKFATLSLDLVKLPPLDARREIRVTMEFGDTEIRATAVDMLSGRSIKTSFDFFDV